MAVDPIKVLEQINNALAKTTKKLGNIRSVNGAKKLVKDFAAIKQAVAELNDQLSFEKAAKLESEILKRIHNVEKSYTKSVEVEELKREKIRTNFAKTRRRDEDIAFKRRIDKLTSYSGRLAEFFKMQMLWYPAKAITFKVLSIPREVLTTTAEFKDTLLQLSSVAQMLPDQLEATSKEIQRVGTLTKFSMIEIGAAAKQLAQAGFSSAEIIASLEPIASLATATASSIQQTTSLLSTIIRAFNVSTTKINEISDVLANAVTKSRLSIQDLNTAFSYVASAAAQAGVSYKDTVAELAILANAGMKSTTAATGLRMALLKMISPTKKAEKAIKNAGLSIEDLSVQSKGLEGVLTTLEKLNAKEIVSIFSARSANAILALINAGKQARTLMRESLEVQGIADAMRQEQLLGLKQSWKNLQDTAEKAIFGIGNTFESALAVKIRAFKRLIEDSEGSVNFLGKSLKFAVDNIGKLVSGFALLQIPKAMGLGALFDVKKARKILAARKAVANIEEGVLKALQAQAALEAGLITSETARKEAVALIAANEEAIVAAKEAQATASLSIASSISAWAIPVTVVAGFMLAAANSSRKFAEAIEQASTNIKELSVNLFKARGQLFDIRIEAAKLAELSGKSKEGKVDLTQGFLGLSVKGSKEKAKKIIESIIPLFEKVALNKKPILELEAKIDKAKTIEDVKAILEEVDKVFSDYASGKNAENLFAEILKNKLDTKKIGWAFRHKAQLILLDLQKGLSLDQIKQTRVENGTFDSEEEFNKFLALLGFPAIKGLSSRLKDDLDKEKASIARAFSDFTKAITANATYLSGTTGLSKQAYALVVEPLKRILKSLEVAKDSPEYKKAQDQFNLLLQHIFIEPDENKLKIDFTKLDKKLDKAIKKALKEAKKGYSIKDAKKLIRETFVEIRSQKLKEIDAEIASLKKQHKETNVDVSEELARLYAKRNKIASTEAPTALKDLDVERSKRLEKIIKLQGRSLKLERDLAKIKYDSHKARELDKASLDNAIELTKQQIETLKAKKTTNKYDNEELDLQIKILEKEKARLEISKKQLQFKYNKEDWQIRKATLDTLIKSAKAQHNEVKARQLNIQKLKEEIEYLTARNNSSINEVERMQNIQRIMDAEEKLRRLQQDTDYATVFQGIQKAVEDLGNKYADAMNKSLVAQEFLNTSTKTFESSMSDGLTNIIQKTESVSDAFKNMANNIRQSLERLISEKATKAFLNILVGLGQKALKPFINPEKGVTFETKHTGGIIGQSSSPGRKFPASLLAVAPRLHDGLAPDEFPAILQKGEKVIPKNQVNQPMNVTVNVINKTSNEVTATVSQPRFDGKQYIIDTVLSDIKRGGPLRAALGSR